MNKLDRINAYNPIPITVGSNAFGNINKTTCILHVPIGSLAAYDAAPYWTDFINIIADL
jgi:hypothetical protein